MKVILLFDKHDFTREEAAAYNGKTYRNTEKFLDDFYQTHGASSAVTIESLPDFCGYCNYDALDIKYLWLAYINVIDW